MIRTSVPREQLILTACARCPKLEDELLEAPRLDSGRAPSGLLQDQGLPKSMFRSRDGLRWVSAFMSPGGPHEAIRNRVGWSWPRAPRELEKSKLMPVTFTLPAHCVCSCSESPRPCSRYLRSFSTWAVMRASWPPADADDSHSPCRLMIMILSSCCSQMPAESGRKNKLMLTMRRLPAHCRLLERPEGPSRCSRCTPSISTWVSDTHDACFLLLLTAS